MALTITARGTDASASAIAPASDFAAGELAVLCLAYDNAVSGGADPLSSVTDSKGNTWTSRHSALRVSPGTNLGTILHILTSPQDGGTLTTGDTITVSWTTDPANEVATLWGVAGSVGNAVFKETGTGALGTGGTSISVTTGTIVVGDAVIAAVAYEYGAATFTADSDTTNGSWSSEQKAGSGTGTSGQSIISQYKVQTTADSTQTYNPTHTNNSDFAAGWIVVTEAAASSGRRSSAIVTV